MSFPASPASPPAIVVSEGSRAYLGYRWRGGATVRLPSGGYVHVPSSAGHALAAAVLDDRLGGAASDGLVDRFRRDWVGPRARGEFVWPVAAVDEWLTTSRTLTASAAPPRSRIEARRFRAIAHRLFAAPFLRVGATPSPRGGH